MKKITLMIFVSLLSFCGFSQGLPPEDFEDPWTPVPASGAYTAADWLTLNNEFGVEISWIQQNHTGPLPSLEGVAGTHSAFINKQQIPDPNVAIDFLVSPEFEMPAGGVLTFWSKLTQAGDQGNMYKVYILPEGGDAADMTDYVLIQDWTEPELALSPLLVYEEKTVTFGTAYDGDNVRIAFVMEGDDGDRWQIDLVSVTQPCLEPASLTASNFQTDSANLSWANPGGATGWQIEILSDGDAPTGYGFAFTGGPSYTATTKQTGNPLNQTPLTPDTNYKYYVKAVCADGGTSDWVGPFFFSTVALGENCNDPIVVGSLPFSDTDNTGNYGDQFYDGSPGASGCGSTNGYLNGNDVVYSYTAGVTGTVNIDVTGNGTFTGVFVYTSCANIGVNCAGGAVSGGAATPISIANFAVTAGTTYYIVISTWAAPQTTAYTLNIQQVFCAAPTGLTAANVDNDSAELTWNAGAATSWQLVVQPQGAGLPTGAGQTVTDNTSLLVTQTTAGFPLTEATAYEYYVRADCNDTNFSVWAGPYAFTTTQVPVPLDYVQNFEGIHGFTLSNGTQTNKWFVGTAVANAPSPTHALYISNDNGVTNSFTNNVASVVHAYRDIQMPAAVDQVSLSFDWRNLGEVGWDYIRVWLVPATFNPTVGTQITAAASGGIQIGGNFVGNANWQNNISVINAAPYANQVMRLVFEWRNDTSGGTNPPAAIDNVNMAVITCPAPTALAIDTLTDEEVTFDWVGPTSVDPTFDYVFGPSSVPPTDATVPTGNVEDPLVTIGSLAPSTTYYFWVRSNCGSGDESFWVGPMSFTTPQVPAPMDYSQDFELPSTGWALSNGTQTNKWFIGEAVANAPSPTHSLYVSNDNGVTNAYTNNAASVVHAYRDIQMPATLDQINLSFDWRNLGETGFDYIRVWLVPVTYTPTPGTQVTAAASGGIQLGANFVGNANWSTYSQTINAAAYGGTARRLIFEWRNDGIIGTNPPAAVDNINLEVITCPQPTNLVMTVLTEDEVTFTWTGPTSVTPTFDYWLTTTPTPPVEGTVPDGNVSAATVTISDLPPSTNYFFWVRSNCGTGDVSFWTGPVNFNTPQVPTELDYEEDFEGTPGWTLSNGTQTNKWYIGEAVANAPSPTHSLYISNDLGVTNAYSNNATSVVHAYRDVVIPAGAGQLDFSFDWRNQGENGFDYIRVWRVPITYTPVTGTQITAAASGGVQIGGNFVGNANWSNAAFVLDATGYAATTQRFIFEWRNDGIIGTNPPAAVDNVTIDLITCPQPTALNILSVGMTEVELAWTEIGSATEWEVYVVPNGDPAPTEDTVGTTADSNPFPYSPIEPGVAYQFYVRAVCADDDKSKWSGPFAFNSSLCEVEDQCAYVFEMWDSFGDSWNGNTMSIIQNGIVVATLTGPLNEDDQNSVFQTVNLCGGIPFQLFWNAGGAFAGEVGVSITNFYDEEIYNKPPGTGAQNSELYAGIPVCTPITCPQPTDLVSTGFDLTSVILSWTPGGAETQWEVVVQAMDGPYPGDTPAESYIVDEPEFLAEELVEGEFYEYYVRAICGDDDLSFWSGPMSFNIFNPEGCNIEVVDIGNPEVGTIVNGTEYVLCPEDDNTVQLSASYLETGDTSTYAVESIDYNPPYPFTGGTPVSVGTDDVWSPVFNLPFDFCFYGNNYSSVIVGSNGVVSFDVSDAGGYCPWSFNQTIPNAGFPILNAIYGVYQDILPTVFNDYANPNINVQVLGNYPCRALVVNYSEVAQFSCNGDDDADIGAQTTQIVLYEITNVIEIYVGRRVPCPGWNNGNGVIGIQNAAGTLATVPEGRNTGAWSAIEEAWRFIPDGESNVTFEWLQDGDVVTTDTEYEVTVTNVPTVMTARATYTDCNGDEIVKESSLTLSVADPIEVEDPQDLTACSTGEDVIFDLTEALEGMVADPENYTFAFYSTEEAALAGEDDASEPALDPQYPINEDVTLWIRVMRVGEPCAIALPFNIDINNVPPVFEVTDGFSLCEGTSGTIEVTGGNWADGEAVFTWTLDGEELPDTTSSITVSTGGEYEVTVNVGGCVGTESINVTIVPIPQAEEVEDVVACDSHTLAALTVGTYYDAPGGPAGGDPRTDLVIEEAGITTIYVYAESGTNPNCWTETSFTVTINESPELAPIEDVEACLGYTLPELASPNSNYFTAPNGGGEMLEAGDVIDTVGDTVIYVYEETGTEPNCSDEVFFTVTVYEAPEPFEIDDIEECVSYTLPALPEGYEYYSGTEASGVMLDANTVITSDQVIYIYAEGEVEGCFTETSFTIDIKPTPVFNLGGPYVFCNVDDATVAVNAENFNAGDATYEWIINGVASAETGSSINATEFGNYTVIVTLNGCTAEQTVQVTQDTTVIGVEITDECIDNIYTLTASDVDGSFEPLSASYAWTGPNGFTANTQSAVPVELGVYNVTITTAEGCVGAISFEVVNTQCFIQRGISPGNMDGDNDFFDLSTMDVRQLSIFNRYGQEVYSRSNYTNEWYGQTNSGDELPTGTYFYMIERDNGEQITGWIYINREE